MGSATPWPYDRKYDRQSIRQTGSGKLHLQYDAEIG